MRTLTIFLMLLICGLIQGQTLPIDSTTGLVSYSNVVQKEGATADEIYGNIKLWVATNYKSAQSVIQMDDPNSKTLVIKAGAPIQYKIWDYGHWRYTLTFQCKDGRYKYTITQIAHDPAGTKMHSGGAIELEKPECGGMYMTKIQWADLKEIAHNHFITLSLALNNLSVNALTPANDW